MHSAKAYGRLVGALVGLGIWMFVVSPYLTGGVVMPLEQRILLSLGSLLALLIGGLVLGQAVARFLGRR